jgi:hypothetical protein
MIRNAKEKTMSSAFTPADWFGAPFCSYQGVRHDSELPGEWRSVPPDEPGLWWYEIDGNVFLLHVWVDSGRLCSRAVGLSFERYTEERYGQTWYPKLSAPPEPKESTDDDGESS